jgi:hypothetical protein
LDDPINWGSIGKTTLIVYFTEYGITANSQFFYSSSTYPSTNIFYNAFNFFTNDVVITSNAGYTRAADNNNYRFFALGNEILSFIYEDVAANSFSRTTPALIADNRTKDYVRKREPNGTPIIANPSGRYLIAAPKLFNQVILFPLGKLDSVTLSDVTKTNYLNNVDNIRVDASLQYLLIDMQRLVSVDFTNVKLLDIAPTNTTLDNVFTAIKPIIGNKTLTWSNDRTYSIIGVGNLVTGSWSTAGPVQSNVSGTYRYTRDTAVADHVFYPYEHLITTGYPDLVFYRIGNTWEQTTFTNPMAYDVDNILLWHDRTKAALDIPSATLTTLAFLHPIDAFLRPNTFSNNDVTSITATLGMANAIYESDLNSYVFEMVNFTLIDFPPGDAKNYYSDFNLIPSSNTPLIKNLSQINVLSRAAGISNAALHVMDALPFQTGGRYFDYSVDMRAYFQVKNYYTMSIHLKFAPTPSSPLIDGMIQLGEFNMLDVMRQFRQVTMSMVPLKTTAGTLVSRSIVLYSTLGRRRRSQLQPMFLYNPEQVQSLWYEYQYDASFQIYSNNVGALLQVQPFIEIFIFLR